MDSSFLSGLHISLGLFACILFIKMMIQFGVPNHSSRVISYLVGLSTATYFVGLALTDLSLVNPWLWMKWRALPMIAGSLALFLQTIMLTGSLNQLRQKAMVRFPILAALLCFAFFSYYADFFLCCFLILGGLFLIISVKKSRYQKRLYFKMLLMFLIQLALNYVNIYWAYVVGQVFLVFTVFYIFLFEHSFGLMGLVDDFKISIQGDLK
jgi:hypothetical protein